MTRLSYTLLMSHNIKITDLYEKINLDHRVQLLEAPFAQFY